MIISFSRRFIFVHIHKCAGESIEWTCAPYLTRNDVLIGARSTDQEDTTVDEALGRLTGLNRHSSAPEIRDRLESETYKRFFRFAVVRRPEERIFSLYKFSIGQIRSDPAFRQRVAAIGGDGADWGETVEALWRSAGRTMDDAKCLVADLGYLDVLGLPKETQYQWTAIRGALSTRSFEEFIESPFTQEDPGFRSQYSMVFDPVTGESLVDRVIPIDRLAEEWPAMRRLLGVSEDLAALNRSDAGGIPPLSDAARETVRAMFRADYDAFGFDDSTADRDGRREVARRERAANERASELDENLDQERAAREGFEARLHALTERLERRSTESIERLEALRLQIATESTARANVEDRLNLLVDGMGRAAQVDRVDALQSQLAAEGAARAAMEARLVASIERVEGMATVQADRIAKMRARLSAIYASPFWRLPVLIRAIARTFSGAPRHR